MPLETVWQLGEAVFTRNGGAAVRIMRDLLSAESALLGILRQLRGQLQTEFKVCSILSTGGSRDEVARAFPYMNGNILEKHIQMASGYGMEAFKKGLLAIDADDGLIADRLMVTLTTY
jgi:DNA polymerase-3 subunit delta